MRHSGPFRREPPPEKSDFLAILLSVAAMLIGLGLTAFCLRDAGVIENQTLLLILVVLVTAAGATFMVMDSDRDARAQAARKNEIPPPFDIHLVWPPADRGAAKSDRKARPANDTGDAPGTNRP